MGDLDACIHPEECKSSFNLKEGGFLVWCSQCGATMTRESARNNLQISNDPWNHPADTRVSLGVHDDALLIAASRHLKKSTSAVVGQALRLLFVALPREDEKPCACLSAIDRGNMFRR